MIVSQNKYNDQRFKIMDIKKNKSSSSILECTPADAFQTAFGNFRVGCHSALVLCLTNDKNRMINALESELPDWDCPPCGTEFHQRMCSAAGMYA